MKTKNKKKIKKQTLFIPGNDDRANIITDDALKNTGRTIEIDMGGRRGLGTEAGLELTTLTTMGLWPVLKLF